MKNIKKLIENINHSHYFDISGSVYCYRLTYFNVIICK